MNELAIFRIVGEVLAVLAAGAVGMVRLVIFGRAVLKAVNALHARMDHLDKCIDDTRKEVRTIKSEDIAELKAIALQRESEQRDILNELMYLKGRNGMPLDKPVGRDNDGQAAG